MKDPWARGQGDHNSREKKGGGKGRGRLKGKLREFSGLMDLSSVFFFGDPFVVHHHCSGGGGNR